MINEVNQKGESPQDSYLKTKKKGNVIVNPKKEDLMSELFKKNLRSAIQEIKEKAVTAVNSTNQKEKKLKKTDPQGGDVQPQNPTCEKVEIDDTQVKKEIAERMRQRLVALTQEHDSKYLGR
jgi:hypothetical protein|tara:strand:+ start:1656 stop:2021 length:366 start_codon:yes stop_codon:yes gene_type:complete